MAGIAAVIGVFIAYNIVAVNFHGTVSDIAFFPATDTMKVFLVVYLITGAGNAINDYYDVGIDRINKPERPIPSGQIGVTKALHFSILLFVSGTGLAMSINPICGAIALFNSLLLIYYASKLKKMALVGNLAVGYLTGSTFLFGGAVFYNYGGILGVSVLFLLATLATMAREIVKDIEDLEGDSKEGASTLPIILGAKKAAYIASFIGIVAVLSSPVPYLQSFMSIRYLFIVALADILFFFAVYEIIYRENPVRSSKMFKMAMGFALISFIAGT